MTSFDLQPAKTTKRSPYIQAKLTIGQPNDRYEQEADRMAEQVMRMPEGGEAVQRQCGECEEEGVRMKPLGESISPIVQKQEEEELLQPKADGSQANTASTSLENRLSSREGQGQSLPEGTQQTMSRAFGADFSGVKVHTDGAAVQMNRELGARAFTHGANVYFNQGEYNPGSADGKRLLGHELTHVVQQGREQQCIQKEDDKKTSSNPKSSQDIHEDKFALYKQNEAIEYFSKYEKFADEQLNAYYQKTTVAKEKQLKGKMFATAARKIYDKKGDLKYVVPVEFALAQARLEGGVGRTERTEGNVFNVGAYDSGKSKYEKSINTLEKGFDNYYEAMSKNWLQEKKPEELLQPGNFTYSGGQVYATNPLYEAEISAEIGLMHMRNMGIGLSNSVGPGKKNNETDIAFVGEMFTKLGYLDEKDKTDVTKVTNAIADFQKEEVVASEKQWYKDRKIKVTAEGDKDDLATKENNYTDGVLSPTGPGIGLLYFKTHMGGQIPALGNKPNVTEKKSGN